MNDYKVSLVIPCRNDNPNTFLETLYAIDAQSLLPDELVIIDSSDNDVIKNTLDSFKINIPIVYKSISPSFAGFSTNLGISISSFSLIALLDTKTSPKPNWLKKYINYMRIEDVEVVFGSTVFYYKSPFQKAVRATSYGAISHQTVPGTIVAKKVALKIRFLEDIRSAYDLDWKNRIMTSVNHYTPSKAYISYNDFPSNILAVMKKYFQYSFYTGMTTALRSMKEIYLTIFLVLSALIIPRWNFFMNEWGVNQFYAPDITKKYFLSLIISFLILQFWSYLFRKNPNKNISYKILKFILYMYTFYAVFNWNAEIANWAEDAVLYIPHVTKIFIALLVFFSLIYRGLFKPIHSGEDLDYLLPLNWLFVGFIGLVMDLSKAPGFIFGACWSRILKIYHIK